MSEFFQKAMESPLTGAAMTVLMVVLMLGFALYIITKGTE